MSDNDHSRPGEEEMDRFLRDGAADYNRPPPTPTEAIWTKIVQQRESGTGAEGRGRVARFPVWGVVAAAAAVLVAGIAIGRFTAAPSETGPTLAATDDEAVELAAVSQVAYRVAASEHLSRVETFLTLFQADARAGRATDEEYNASARSLLLNTRLLQDSPIAQDLALKTLLDDVELVLAQIAQYSAEHAEDLEFIDKGIQQRSVLLKLRSAIPAGPAQVSGQGAL